MNLQELRRIREKERSTDSLQDLREDFYVEVSEYLETLTTRRNQAAGEVDDPFADPDVRRISDELSTAERTAEAIYERRVGKIVKLASFAAADMTAETDGFTAEERDLFEAIVEEITANRERVLETLEADSTVEVPLDDESSPRGDSPEPPQSDPEDRSGEEPVDEPARTTVRITKDVGTIVGVDDRPYDLGVDDIVTLPTKNAEPLLQRDAAEPVE